MDHIFQAKANEVRLVEDMMIQIGEKKKRKVVDIAWVRLLVGWIKVNFDGASKSNSEVAGYGSLCRGLEGKWIMGF